MSNRILAISPHDDDSGLFLAFTCLREKPLIVIVTDSYIQPLRGEIGCDAETRAEETRRAHEVLGCPTVRLGIPDNELNERILKEKFVSFQGFDKVYIPAIQGGNLHHDLVSRVAREVFGDKVVEYTTYTKTELWTKGNIEIIPTQEELDLKNKALLCYTSQINLPATRPHFLAVQNRSEWLL